MTFPLAINLRTPDDKPVVGATIIIKPRRVNPTASGTVLTTASAVTDNNGHATINVIPSTVGTYYILRINSNTQANIISPFQFQMPPQATSLNQLLTAQLEAVGEVPPGIQIKFPSEPFGRVTYSTLDAAIQIASSTTDTLQGDWVDLYRTTNDSVEPVFTEVILDLEFRAGWSFDATDWGVIDIEIQHDGSDGTVKNRLLHQNIYISDIESRQNVHVQYCVYATLEEGDYILAHARVNRKLTTGTVTLEVADTSFQLVKYEAIEPSNIMIAVDPATMTGDGSTDNPTAVKIPFTQAEKDKLTALPADAAPPQDGDAIVTKLEALPEAQKLDAVTGLKNLPHGITEITGLTDVTITSPTDGQVLVYDDTDSAFENRDASTIQLGGDQIVTILEHQEEPHKLPKSALQGETTVSGNTTQPDASTVPAWTLYAVQATNADDPVLYISGATFDGTIPADERNQVIITTDSSGIFSLNPRRGSTTDNNNNFVGSYAAINRGSTHQIIISIFNGYTPATQTLPAGYDTDPPTTIYIKGIGGFTGVTTFTRSGPSFIGNRTYNTFTAMVSQARAQAAQNSEQTLTFWTDVAGTAHFNIKPETQRQAGTWHQLLDEETKLQGLADVSITTPSTGQVLTYDGTGFVNQSLPGPHSGDLDSLTDVTITSPVDGQVLTYDGTDFVNEALPAPGDLASLSNVTISSPQVNDVITFNGSDFVNQAPHEIHLTGDQIVTILEHADPKLSRSALQGETTVSGGPTLPDFADVPNWTLRVRQDTTADNPSLYLTSASYSTPIANRNRAIVTTDSNGLFSLNPRRGSSTDNYDNAIGVYSIGARTGSTTVTLALYTDPLPPNNLYVRGVAGENDVIALTRTGPGFIGGRTYNAYTGTIASATTATASRGTEQTLTFFTDSAGATAFNLKPAAQPHSRQWHLQTPVTPDYSVTDSRSPAFIKNKPTPTTLGKLIAVTAALPTTATAFSTSTTIARYAPSLTITGAEVTTNYTVANNSVLGIHPYPQNQFGWIVRALTGTTELCRVVIPLTPTVAYVNTASILADTRICGHTHMGTSSNTNYFLAFQAHNGNQAQHAGTGHLATDIEVFVAINQTTGSVTFPANTIIEVREAVVN